MGLGAIGSAGGTDPAAGSVARSMPRSRSASQMAAAGYPVQSFMNRRLRDCSDIPNSENYHLEYNVFRPL